MEKTQNGFGMIVIIGVLAILFAVGGYSFYSLFMDSHNGIEKTVLEKPAIAASSDEAAALVPNAVSASETNESSSAGHASTTTKK